MEKLSRDLPTTGETFASRIFNEIAAQNKNPEVPVTIAVDLPEGTGFTRLWVNPNLVTTRRDLQASQMDTKMGVSSDLIITGLAESLEHPQGALVTVVFRVADEPLENSLRITPIDVGPPLARSA